MIVILAAVLRLWGLGGIPPSLDWDEAAWGYNSYSILQTRADEYGKFLPVAIRSFNDYKPALYAYLDLPSIAIFGLNNFGVRFPDAIFGVLSVLTTYFLVKEMFKRRDLALLAALLLAISPWNIQFARFTHEGIVGLELNLLMVLFFLKGIKNPIFLSFAAFFAGLALYSYQNEKLFVPLLALAAIAIYSKDLLKLPRKYLVSAILVGALVALPMVIYVFTTPASLTRAKGASFLNNPAGVVNEKFYPQRELIDKQNHDYVGLMIDNRRVAYLREVAGNYLLHFDPNFLFIKGDLTQRHQPPGMSHLYLIELPFLLLGIFVLLSGKFDRKIKSLIFLWILIVPIPAAFTWDVPNAGRTINFMPTFQILTALGLLFAYSYTKKWKKSVRYVSYFVFGLLALTNFAYYLNQYFIEFKYVSSDDFQYGYNEIIPIVQKYHDHVSRIAVSTSIPLDQSYIFFLYNLKYPPALYQKRSTAGIYQVKHAFDKYEFRNIDPKEDKKNTLYVVGAKEFLPTGQKTIIKEISFLDNTPAYVIYQGTEP